MENVKALVHKHEISITRLVGSVEHLVKSQQETNKRLEDIIKALSKQDVLSNKFQNMEQGSTEAFERVDNRINEISNIQNSPEGCHSSRLISKDIKALTYNVRDLVGVVKRQEDKLEDLAEKQESFISTEAVKWFALIVLTYAIVFGTYVVQSINELWRTDERVTTIQKNIIDDTEELMQIHRTKYSYVFQRDLKEQNRNSRDEGWVK